MPLHPAAAGSTMGRNLTCPDRPCTLFVGRGRKRKRRRRGLEEEGRKKGAGGACRIPPVRSWRKEARVASEDEEAIVRKRVAVLAKTPRLKRVSANIQMSTTVRGVPLLPHLLQPRHPLQRGVGDIKRPVRGGGVQPKRKVCTNMEFVSGSPIS